MIILPAIDMRAGKCVRLFQGDYDQETVYFDQPLEVAKMWQTQGAEYLHVVDLDGAKAGELVHFDLVKAMAEQTDLKIELGGGIRSDEDFAKLMDCGVSYGIIGTKAIESAQWLQDLIKDYPEQVVVGVDARDGQVATDGWTKTSEVSALNFVQSLEAWGAKRVIFTDIATDGAFTGPNLLAIQVLLKETQNIQITVSGGVSSLDDLKEIQALEEPRIFGAIVGKALYDKRIELSEALSLC